MIRYVSVVIGVCLNVSMACGNQCYQLVPYEPRHVNVILPTFHEEQRSFNLADKEWIIEQQWSDIGVAAVVWEAALLLCDYLIHLGTVGLEGAKVVELGAGTGLVGLIASTLGASSVVMTDKDTRAATHNLNLNKHHLQDKNISVTTFTWGGDVSSLHPPYKVILAADVVYIEEVFSDLIQSFIDLTDLESVVYLACKRRYERHDRFFKLLADTGMFRDEVVWTWPEKEEVKVHKLTRTQ